MCLRDGISKNSVVLSLKRREDGESRVLGEYLRNQVDLRADSAGEPVTVAVGGLDAPLLMNDADAVPGRDRVGDDVAPIGDREAVADEERGPVGDQLGTAVVEDSSQGVILLLRRAAAQGQVGEADVPPERSTYESCGRAGPCRAR